MRKISKNELDSLLVHNACEIIFLRRHIEKDRPIFRRMLCSKSMELLNSENGIRSLNFRLPAGPPKVDEVKHNLCVAWDIFMQDYRNISMDKCFLVQQIPDNEIFWKYYNEVLYPMTQQQKMAFMDTV